MTTSAIYLRGRHIILEVLNLRLTALNSSPFFFNANERNHHKNPPSCDRDCARKAKHGESRAATWCHHIRGLGVRFVEVSFSVESRKVYIAMGRGETTSSSRDIFRSSYRATNCTHVHLQKSSKAAGFLIFNVYCMCCVCCIIDRPRSVASPCYIQQVVLSHIARRLRGRVSSPHVTFHNLSK